jgi:hypothetical protein
MELDLQSLFGLHVQSFTHRLRPPPPAFGHIYEVAKLLVSQDRRHLFVTLGPLPIIEEWVCDACAQKQTSLKKSRRTLFELIKEYIRKGKDDLLAYALFTLLLSFF